MYTALQGRHPQEWFLYENDFLIKTVYANEETITVILAELNTTAQKETTVEEIVWEEYLDLMARIGVKQCIGPGGLQWQL